MRKISYLTLILLLFITTSCSESWIKFTPKLWAEKSYSETFDRFFVARDGWRIVFIGRRYHYVFYDDSKVLLKLLNSKSRDLLFINPRKTYLKLELGNRIRGSVVIEAIADDNFSKGEVYDLHALGFRNDERNSLSLSIPIRGNRYRADGRIGVNLPHLNRTYIIPIHYNSSTLSKIKRAALTPIAVTADALVILGRAVLVPIQGTE